jgi:hypothetical protein
MRCHAFRMASFRLSNLYAFLLDTLRDGSSICRCRISFMTCWSPAAPLATPHGCFPRQAGPATSGQDDPRTTTSRTNPVLQERSSVRSRYAMPARQMSHMGQSRRCRRQLARSFTSASPRNRTPIQSIDISLRANRRLRNAADSISSTCYFSPADRGYMRSALYPPSLIAQLSLPLAQPSLLIRHSQCIQVLRRRNQIVHPFSQ